MVLLLLLAVGLTACSKEEAATEALAALEAEGNENPRGLFSVIASGVKDSGENPSASELRRRIDLLPAVGAGVLLSRAREMYRQTAFVNRFTDKPVRFAVSVGDLVQVLQENQYRGLEGRLLEGVSRLLAQNVQLYVYPMPAEVLRERVRPLGAEAWVPSGQELVGADRVQPSPPLRHLYDYLLATEFIRSMQPIG